MGHCGPSFDGRLVSSAGFRMSSPVRKTVSSRLSFVSPPGKTLSARVEDAATQPGVQGLWQ
jgi:hypothetical protein